MIPKTIKHNAEKFLAGENPECTNGQRAKWARDAVQAYVDTKNEGLSYNVEEDIGDLITDLCHLCDSLGQDSRHVMDKAMRRWREEK